MLGRDGERQGRNRSLQRWPGRRRQCAPVRRGQRLQRACIRRPGIQRRCPCVGTSRLGRLRRAHTGSACGLLLQNGLRGRRWLPRGAPTCPQEQCPPYQQRLSHTEGPEQTLSHRVGAGFAWFRGSRQHRTGKHFTCPWNTGPSGCISSPLSNPAGWKLY
ncbi:hypothetical protein DB31_6923 [Hyalangium minutum]|uniref:Uncharacterized protein n=1 Tax=Hyalangium minutum TaxID=394096 RepID=A0A085WMV8_9BACT|nr:hypothetical protein DB31_6923 [Hyalangium minutum]